LKVFLAEPRTNKFGFSQFIVSNLPGKVLGFAVALILKHKHFVLTYGIWMCRRQPLHNGDGKRFIVHADEKADCVSGIRIDHSRLAAEPSAMDLKAKAGGVCAESRSPLIRTREQSELLTRIATETVSSSAPVMELESAIRSMAPR
jgi:hypothetical protein